MQGFSGKGNQMSIALITGSAGLIGAQSVKFFADKGLDIIGIDNDMRSYFFGPEATTAPMQTELFRDVNNYTHHNIDIRNLDALEEIFNKFGKEIALIIHTAAQPSHDWAAKEPFTDFSVNATGTLNLLELTRQYCPEATFIFTSTNKVYGDTPNQLPLIEQDDRWELDPQHSFAEFGIDESMSIDQSKHSIFGASKVAADVMVQEYGRYFGLHTACFRGGCLTGPQHAGAELHGFLSYLAKCIVTEHPYTIFGYKGKQVRDNIHSADLVNAFWHFHQAPRIGEVYNIGGGRHSNCSMKEAISICEKISGKTADISYSEQNRAGDHIWWISDTRKFQGHYPDWKYEYNVNAILEEIIQAWHETKAN